MVRSNRMLTYARTWIMRLVVSLLPAQTGERPSDAAPQAETVPAVASPPTASAAAHPFRMGWMRRIIVRVGIALALAVILTAGVSMCGNTTHHSHSAPASDDAWHDSLVQTIAGYCSMETIAGMRLDPTVLDPYLVPDGPWRQRRFAAIAARSAHGRAHVARLVAWQIRGINRASDRALVVTTEVWENQESTMAAPAHAMVMVAYDMRWDGMQWRIWDLSITALNPPDSSSSER